MKHAILTILALVIVSILAAPGVADQQAGEMTLDVKEAAKHFPTRGYSPYADRGFPTQPLWGDTHLHTSNSVDAFAFGNRLGPEEAYRFARGETVTSSTGQRVQLSRPIDFLVVADHGVGMSAMMELYKGNPTMMRDERLKRWHLMMNESPEKGVEAAGELISAGSQGDIPPAMLDRKGKLPAVGNTVDVKNATWTNTIGDPELITVWKDPDFSPAQPAFYYARVIEIPTPRWTAYDAKRFGVKMSKEVPMTTQERAYTSPIWYTP